MILSIIIPARNEWPNVVHTCYSIIHALEAEGFKQRDFEIIIVNNASNDDFYPQRGTKGTTSYLMGRGMYWENILRVVYFPIAGNHAARNQGAKIARGEYLYFSDAHMAYRPGFFTAMLKAQKESGGLVHGGVQWMGAYPPHVRSTGFGYTIKLGEEIKGTWNNRRIAETWFYIPAQGHWGLLANKKQFFDFGGYPSVHRTYGGGEFYTDMKWWLFGSCVVTEPNAIGYHLASGRGYSYDAHDYIHNVLNIAYALGMDDWRERAYLNWCRTHNKGRMDTMMAEGEKEMTRDRAFIEKRRKKTFNELIVERPWEVMNKQRHGNEGASSLLVFHDTILPHFQKDARVWEAYQNSKYQKGLEDFINSSLSEFVYKRI